MTPRERNNHARKIAQAIKTNPDVNAHQETISKLVFGLSSNQIKLILATGLKPKFWNSIVRHAKVKVPPYTHQTWYSWNPWFSGVESYLIFNIDGNHSVQLTPLGGIVKNMLNKRKG